jgi:hypothetical protein
VRAVIEGDGDARRSVDPAPEAEGVGDARHNGGERRGPPCSRRRGRADEESLADGRMVPPMTCYR